MSERLERFGSSQYSSEEQEAIQRALKARLGPNFISKRPIGGGSHAAYLEGHRAVSWPTRYLDTTAGVTQSPSSPSTSLITTRLVWLRITVHSKSQIQMKDPDVADASSIMP